MKTLQEIKNSLGAHTATQPHGTNSHILHFEHGTILQSYNTDIVINVKGETYLTDAWEYSTTTGKHRNAYLLEDKKATQKKLKDGTYQLIS